MKESLLQIADYIEALELRVAQLENQLSAKLDEKDAKLAELEKRIAELEARPVFEQSEIAMDWIDEPEIIEEPESAEEPKPAPMLQQLDFPEELQIVEEQEEYQLAAPEEPQPTVEEDSQLTVSEEPQPATLEPGPVAPQPAAPQSVKPAPGAPVSDIKQAISLGDRFLFQRELFNQNGELMQKTIEALNKMPNLDGAVAYIRKHFEWDEESATYTLFLNALHRRFG